MNQKPGNTLTVCALNELKTGEYVQCVRLLRWTEKRRISTLCQKPGIKLNMCTESELKTGEYVNRACLKWTKYRRIRTMCVSIKMNWKTGNTYTVRVLNGKVGVYVARAGNRFNYWLEYKL